MFMYLKCGYIMICPSHFDVACDIMTLFPPLKTIITSRRHNNSSDGTEYLEYNERQTKTRTGENIVDIRQIKPKMFATGDTRNTVESYKLYASKRPYGFSLDDDPFYLSIRTIPLADERSDL